MKRAAAMRSVRAGHAENGVASWYGVPYHGRPTASGEVFDMSQHTAAHRRLPFGTVARVEHRGNGRSTEVRINDRGPFVKGRFLDLSRAAAEEIGLVRDGTAKVRLRVTRPPQAKGFAVQAGVFASLDGAVRMRDRLQAHFPLVRIFYISSSGRYRVLVGSAGSHEAEGIAQHLVRVGIPTPEVVPLPTP